MPITIYVPLHITDQTHLVTVQCKAEPEGKDDVMIKGQDDVMVKERDKMMSYSLTYH